MPTRYINSWSSPRNISTAFMYAMAQRKDTTVIDEPLYAHYLTNEKDRAAHPGESEIIASQSQNAVEVINKILMGNYQTPIAFFKQMTHHLVALDWSFLDQMEHVILIRDPRRIIASYSKVVQQPSIKDVGIKKQVELYNHLLQLNKKPVIIDSAELLKNPEFVLSEMCGQLNIAFDANMLKWQAGARPEDGIWATYWYDNVHCSTGFQPYRPKEIELPERLEKLAADCLSYYHTLLKVSIKSPH